MTEMANSPAVSVVVPLFNEEESVPILQSELRAALSALDHEIVFVDDGSIDRTVEQIETAPNIRVIVSKKIPDKAPPFTPASRLRAERPQFSSMEIAKDPADIPSFSRKSQVAPTSFVVIA